MSRFCVSCEHKCTGCCSRPTGDSASINDDLPGRSYLTSSTAAEAEYRLSHAVGYLPFVEMPRSEDRPECEVLGIKRVRSDIAAAVRVFKPFLSESYCFEIVAETIYHYIISFTW